MKIHRTCLVLAFVAGAPQARADVPPPGAEDCRTAKAGDLCQMDVNGAPTGVWGTCLVSQCGTKVPCTDAGAPPECADGGLPDFPGYGLAYNDCLLCNPDAGVPPTAAAHDSSGCSVVGTRPTGAHWWLGAAVLLLLGARQRARGRR